VEKVVISGYCGQKCPEYLGEKMGVQVQATQGHWRKKSELNEEGLSQEDVRFERKLRELDDKKWDNFAEYQWGI